MKPIWIIDDDKSIRWVFEKALARSDLEFKTFSSVPEAMSALEKETPQVIVSDIRMPNGSGLDFLQVVKERRPDVPVIIMTAYSDLESAVAAFQGGAFEYLAKPFDVDQALDVIRRAVEESQRQTTEGISTPNEETPEIIGQAPAMQEVFRAIGRLSRSHATVLINGESGTGKELVARALHRHSPRAEKPFIAINTAAIPKDFRRLRLYCHRVAGVVGEIAAGIFGYRERATLKYAALLGLAFQLTNIIRDVGEDARRGRIYLPQDELERFGVGESALLRGEDSPAFRALMRFQYERAEQTYAQAFALLPAVDRKVQRPGLAMAAVYRALLDEIRRDDFPVLNARVSLPPLRKLWLVGRAWLTA